MSRNKNRRNKNRKHGKAPVTTAGTPTKRGGGRKTAPAVGATNPPAKGNGFADVAHWPEREFARWLMLAALLVATWLVYMNGLAGGWLLDDYGNIVNNNGLVMHGFSWGALWHAMWSFDAGPLGRPLSLMTFALQRFFGGLDAGAFKTVNLVMHLIAVILLYGFTRALLYAWRRRISPATSALRIEWVALAIAAAWALHPMNLTPILYAVQRETVFAALFTLAGLWLYVVIRERFRKTTWPVLGLLFLEVAVFTIVGAYAKETGVLLPLFCLLLEFFVFRFRDEGEQNVRVSPWLYLAALFFPLAKGLYNAYAGFHAHYVTGALILITLALGFLVYHYVERDKDDTRHKLLLLYFILLFVPAVIGLYDFLPNVISGHAFVTREFNLPERVLTEGRIVLIYLWLILIPWLPGMALHHDYTTISTGILSPPFTLGAFLIIAALLLLAWWLRRRRPLVALGIVFFFASQVLESTVFPLELMYEHRVYLGDWGIILAVAALTILAFRPRAVGEWWQRGVQARLPSAGSARALAVIALAVVILLGSLTALRAWHWRSNLALARTEARHHPDSPRGTYLLARIETNKALAGQKKFMRPAFEAAENATRVKNAGLDPWVAMVLLASQTGRPVPDAWFDGMIKAVGQRAFTVSDVNALEALVKCYNRHQCRIHPKKIKQLFHAINHSPRIHKLGMNYANVLVTEANFIGYATHAQRAKSAPKLIKAANVEHHVAQFQVNAFNVALQEGKLKMAQKMFTRVKKLNKLGSLDQTVANMHRQLAKAHAARPAQPARPIRTSAPYPTTKQGFHLAPSTGDKK
jgi:hypothetical protein